MCRRRQQQQEQETAATVSPYDEDINRFFDSVSGITKKVVGQTYNLASEFSWRENEGKNDRYYNRPYQTRDVDLEDQQLGAFDVFNQFGVGGVNPFGLHSLRSPTTRKYNDCLRKQGESVWDSNGNWRCLFPNSEIPNRLLDYKKSHMAGQIVTKEDFRDALEANPGTIQNGVIDLGAKGTYFREFNDFLNWKNTMYENVRKQREESRRRMRDQAKSAINRKSPQQDKAIVSTSVHTSMNSDSADNSVLMKETRTEVFSDGTSVTRNITRTKPYGAKDWASVTEEVQDGKSGWFWNK